MKVDVSANHQIGAVGEIENPPDTEDKPRPTLKISVKPMAIRA